ncbi:MAG: DNA mismatch repair protein MutS, partial [Firmicutes bacterium]|nr:DNA mismatch repair protein MutS [Bacillota bacterium]
ASGAQQSLFDDFLGHTKNKIGEGHLALNARNLEQHPTIDFIVTTLSKIAPTEIISNESIFVKSFDLTVVKNKALPPFSATYEWSFDSTMADKLLSKYVKTGAIAFDSKTERQIGIRALGALIEYLERIQKTALKNIDSIDVVKEGSGLVLDSNARRSLEITESYKERKRHGSLLDVVDNSVTNMGARVIKHWLENPLKDSDIINARLDAVEFFVGDIVLRESLKDLLKQTKDVERLSASIATGKIVPRECISLLTTLNVIPALRQLLLGRAGETRGAKQNDTTATLPSLLKNIATSLTDHTELRKLLYEAIVNPPPAHMRDGGYIKPEFDKQLLEYRNIKVQGKEWLIELEKAEREATNIKGLRVAFNKVHGYYIEISRREADNVPYRYKRKQTLADRERYITDELKQLEDKILNAEALAVELEVRLYIQIKEALKRNVSTLKQVAKALAHLDALLGLSLSAIKHNYVRPKISESVKSLAIKDGRHPVVESLQEEPFVANDVLLDNNKRKIAIITGPNMAGKSTYMRQAALIALLAHIGSFVPAQKADVPLLDRIFTRIGASDDLAYGQSTFMVEMLEVASILKNATSNSLLILDEIGRGTSTYDGVSIAQAVLEHIATTIKAKTLFATHYHELVNLENHFANIFNLSFTAKEIEGVLNFIRKIQDGGTAKSFGIQVAKLAGIPNAVVDRSKEILESLENKQK